MAPGEEQDAQVRWHASISKQALTQTLALLENGQCGTRVRNAGAFQEKQPRLADLAIRVGPASDAVLRAAFAGACVTLVGADRTRLETLVG